MYNLQTLNQLQERWIKGKFKNKYSHCQVYFCCLIIGQGYLDLFRGQSYLEVKVI